MGHPTTPRVLGLLVALAVGALALAGCGKDPVKPPAAKPFTYLAPHAPTSVLQNMVSAYNNRDSVETGVVYDVNYRGYSPGAPLGVGYFTRSDEVHHDHHQRHFGFDVRGEKHPNGVRAHTVRLGARRHDLDDPTLEGNTQLM